MSNELTKTLKPPQPKKLKATLAAEAARAIFAKRKPKPPVSFAEIAKKLEKKGQFAPMARLRFEGSALFKLANVSGNGAENGGDVPPDGEIRPKSDSPWPVFYSAKRPGRRRMCAPRESPKSLSCRRRA